MTTVATSKRFDVTRTELPPCCLRVHPEDVSLVVLGTYKLEKDSGERHGSLDLYSYGPNFKLIHSYPAGSAVLDIKFNPKDSSMLVSAHSTGCVVIWKVDTSEQLLKQVQKCQLFDESTLITSIFFNPNNSRQLLCTLTTGELAIVDLEDLTAEELSTSHELECWTGSFGELGQLQNVVFTGGDDSKLIAHDLRMNSKIWATGYNHHDAGVVSILNSGPNWNVSNPHHMWTGSYDDNLRIFDLRLMDKQNPELITGYIPKVHQKENLGGGVWRLIPSPTDNRVLTCCMYDGARIVDVKEDQFVVSKYFKGEHESMCYGGDWQDEKVVVTCSFYDNVVQAWSPDETVQD